MKVAKNVFLLLLALFQEMHEKVLMSSDQKLKLIDGVDLAKLMIEFSIGVQVNERIVVSKIDQDFFNADD